MYAPLTPYNCFAIPFVQLFSARRNPAAATFNEDIRMWGTCQFSLLESDRKERYY